MRGTTFSSFFHSFLLKRNLWRFEILHESKWAYLPTVWTKYLKQGKEIKQNWTGEKNFDSCFCVVSEFPKILSYKSFGNSHTKFLY